MYRDTRNTRRTSGSGEGRNPWMGAEDNWQGGEPPVGGRPWQEEIPYEDEPAWDEPVYEAYEEETYDESQQAQELIATNRMVLLTCTLESMMSLFALFLLFAEKKSRAIRAFAVQSVGLAACHLAAALMLALVDAVFGGIPFIGFLMNLVCLLAYIAVLIVAVFLRVRMMLAAWRGVRFTLPVVGRRLEKFVG